MKILILTDKYYPSPLANAVCAQNIAEVFMKKGHQVDILAYKDTKIKAVSEYNSIKVYYVTPDLRTQLFYYTKNFPNSKYSSFIDIIAKLLNRGKKLIMMPFYPIYSFSFPFKLMKMIERLHKRVHYDIVISVYCPFDTALATYWFKRKNRNVKWCLYTVDTFINHRYAFLKNKGNDNKWLYKFLDYSDMFIYMRSRVNEYSDYKFNKWRNKMFISDIPCMKKANQKMNPKNNHKNEIWVYAGALYAPHYKADDLIKVFLHISKNKNRVLHFYSGGKELEEIKHFEKETNGKIVCHGYVPHEELINIYRNADVLVSMKYTAQISAKIFEYMSYNKPVIHLSGCPDDPNTDYVSHYSRGYVIRLYKDGSQNGLNSFLDNISDWNKRTDEKTDLSYFEMNKPEYTANKILDVMFNGENI